MNEQAETFNAGKAFVIAKIEKFIDEENEFTCHHTECQLLDRLAKLIKELKG